MKPMKHQIQMTTIATAIALKKIFWDTKSLAPGCYIVKMQSQTNTCVKYFTLMR